MHPSFSRFREYHFGSTREKEVIDYHHLHESTLLEAYFNLQGTYQWNSSVLEFCFTFVQSTDGKKGLSGPKTSLSLVN
jgi:hypothetical protein